MKTFFLDADHLLRSQELKEIKSHEECSIFYSNDASYQQAVQMSQNEHIMCVTIKQRMTSEGIRDLLDYISKLDQFNFDICNVYMMGDKEKTDPFEPIMFCTSAAARDKLKTRDYIQLFKEGEIKVMAMEIKAPQTTTIELINETINYISSWPFIVVIVFIFVLTLLLLLAVGGMR